MNLRDFATPREIEYLDAIEKHGSQRAAAAALGVARTSLQDALKNLGARAAKNGYAPGHFDAGVAPGYRMGKVTIQRGPDGVERVWERQHPADEKAAALLDAIRESTAELPRLAPLPAPAGTLSHLLNLYVFTDYHLGMRAWAEEGGADWNLEIAEALIIRAFEHMVAAAPAARVGLIGQLGDFLHFDSLIPVTPTSRHVVDSAGHYKQMVKAAIRIMRRIIDFALHRHEAVVVVCCEGNHDIVGGGIWLPEAIRPYYENDPRVSFIESATPYYAYEWGATMLAFHHGHLKKLETLPLVFAERYPEIWGRTKKRYAHAGHYHHEVDKKDVGGMRVTQHPTLAPNDSHSARGGYPANQQTAVVTYHERFGKVGENVVTPEMMEDARAA
ncbi:MAG: winged helix-turn-helix domain-containing protein [Alphaproteobacteria bacterium]|jgi:hypothetical protein